MRRQPKVQRPQPTSPELLETLLDFLRRKFYEGHAVEFAKDRPRLLKWVVLWPAKWLQNRGVTLPADRYQAIFFKVFLDAVVFGQDGTKIGYLPAYLAKVIQTHFDHHGESYYDEAKSMRNLVENSVVVLGKLTPSPAADPIRDLAAAATLLKPKKKAPKRPVKDQLSLL